MDSPTRSGRVITVLAATVLLLLSSSMAWATAYEYKTRELIPQGVTIAGVSLGGLNAEQAAAVIAQTITEPLSRPVEVLADGRKYDFNPSGAVEVDVQAMISAAYAPRRSASFTARLRHDLGKVPFTSEVEPVYTVDTDEITEWVESIAEKIDRPAVDATITAVSGDVTLTPSSPGRKTNVREAARAIQSAFRSERALTASKRSVNIPVEQLAPEVTEESLGKYILVNLSRRRIWLYKGRELEKTYPCAIGTPSHPTPTGQFVIELKRKNPSWSNPAPNGWGKDMPLYIPPGPSNPLGTRALNLSASGIRFHGTNKIYSVGTAASHGCMRMYRSDIEDLFERVEVGTPVFIFR